MDAFIIDLLAISIMVATRRISISCWKIEIPIVSQLNSSFNFLFLPLLGFTMNLGMFVHNMNQWHCTCGYSFQGYYSSSRLIKPSASKGSLAPVAEDKKVKLNRLNSGVEEEDCYRA